MNRARSSLVAAIFLSIALPIAAHHSGAMFDNSRSVTLNGTVKTFQWTNPHCFIQLIVPGPKGEPAEWSVEMGSPFEVFRTGVRPATLKAGDKITVVVHPIRDGGRAGLFVSATGPNGKPLGKPTAN